ncbi:hypothetical protein DUT91_24640 [Phyllobacterium salinisoli]|uniref:Uncharacterized protein n=2 Tax=Phyllobacterium salinisoli TaxID=1899321 RepID=A0A368JW20_9HYPH|nr:hypothetical protein DUT91_24640 [Phyllobacterium salinisoli]
MKRARRAYPDDRIISKADSVGLYRLNNTIIFIYISAVAVQLLIILLLPVASLEGEMSNRIVSLWRNMSPNVRDTYPYFQTVEPGLGYKYALSYGLCVYISAVFILTNFFIAIFLNKGMSKPLNNFQIFAFKGSVIAATFFGFGIYYASLVPSKLFVLSSKKIYSNEFGILLINAGIMLAYFGMTKVIFAASKYLKFKGENEHV